MAERSNVVSRGATPMDRAFLLRCWREPGTESSGEAGWRFSVTEVDGGRRRWGCATLDELPALLWDRLKEETE